MLQEAADRRIRVSLVQRGNQTKEEEETDDDGCIIPISIPPPFSPAARCLGGSVLLSKKITFLPIACSVYAVRYAYMYVVLRTLCVHAAGYVHLAARSRICEGASARAPIPSFLPRPRLFLVSQLVTNEPTNYRGCLHEPRGRATVHDAREQNERRKRNDSMKSRMRQ